MKDHKIIEVSSKHVVLRTILFAVAFLTALGAVYFGLTSIAKKTPGWQEASATLDRELPDYSNHFHTLVYMTGSSSEIRQQLASFNKLYTDNLKRVYRLLDSENLYDGYNNIAKLNKSFGQKVKVSTDLYEVLRDAYEKTLTGEYNLFAGPLYHTNRALENAESYDREWEEIRLGLLEKEVLDLSNFSVTFFDDSYVKIDVSEAYRQFLSEYEFDYPVLDFGENYGFYKTVMMDMALSENGYPGCMFYVD